VSRETKGSANEILMARLPTERGSRQAGRQRLIYALFVLQINDNVMTTFVNNKLNFHVLAPRERELHATDAIDACSQLFTLNENEKIMNTEAFNLKVFH
jgi:hypothetical protein